MIDADTFDWIGEAEAKTERAIAHRQADGRVVPRKVRRPC